MEKSRLDQTFSPIERESVAEQVVNRILSLIQSGNLKSGDKMPSERELMSVFNISRPTLREALRALSILGVTDTRKGGGSYISTLSAKELLKPLDFFISLDDSNFEDVSECRRILECQMVAKTAINVDHTGLQEFDRLLEVQRQTIHDPVAFRISDQKFHELLAHISGNKLMAHMADGMYNLAMEARRRASERLDVIQRSVKDHENIVQALHNHDPIAASQAMDIHLRNIEMSTRRELDIAKDRAASQRDTSP